MSEQEDTSASPRGVTVYLSTMTMMAFDGCLEGDVDITIRDDGMLVLRDTIGGRIIAAWPAGMWRGVLAGTRDEP